MVHGFTVARIPLAMLFAAILLSAASPSTTILVCVCLLVFVELTDLIDGALARRWGVVTEWGAMFDPFADSVSRLVVYWALACAGLVLPLVPLAMALRDVSVAYCRIILAKRGRSVSAKWSGKIKAMVQCTFGLLAVSGPWYWTYTGKWTIQALSWIVITVTLVSVIEYAAAAWKSVGEAPPGEGVGQP